MTDTEQAEGPSEPQSRHVVYCGGKSNNTKGRNQARFFPTSQPATAKYSSSANRVFVSSVCTLPPEVCLSLIIADL